MRDKPKIIGIIHMPENIKVVTNSLAEIINAGDRIGIEPSTSEIELFSQKDCSLESAYVLSSYVEKTFLTNEYRKVYKDFLEFYCEIYRFLNQVKAIPVAVGSEVRDNMAITLERKKVSNERISRDEIDKDRLITLPHFDYHVAIKIKEDNLSGVIVGCDHRVITRLVDGEFINLSGIAEEFWEMRLGLLEAAHHRYVAYSGSLPTL
jgi:hypothetical protein